MHDPRSRALDALDGTAGMMPGEWPADFYAGRHRRGHAGGRVPLSDVAALTLREARTQTARLYGGHLPQPVARRLCRPVTRAPSPEAVR